MAQRKVKPTPPVFIEAAGDPEEDFIDVDAERPANTRPVRVNQVTRREYIEDEPIITDDAPADDPPESYDPFAGFNEVFASTSNATLRIWRLPNYDVDGKWSIKGNDRRFCGSIPYDPDNVMLLDQIQARAPLGGMLMLELLSEGKLIKRGQLRLEKTDQPNPYTAATSPAAPAVVIQPAQAPAVDPLLMIKQQADSFLAVADVIKKLQPDGGRYSSEAAPAAEASPLRERLLESVLIKMVESPKADSLERVASMLSGGDSSNWIESAISAVGPSLGTFLTQIGPGLGAYFFSLAGGRGAPMVATSAGVAPALAAASGEAAAQPVQDPGERAWRRVLFRLVDDLLEHHSLIQASQLGLDVHSAAEAVADLAGRFPEHEGINTTIGQLLVSAPAMVIEATMAMVPPQVAARLEQVKASPAVLEWLAELQNEAKVILSVEPPPGDTVNVDESEDKEK